MRWRSVSGARSPTGMAKERAAQGTMRMQGYTWRHEKLKD